MAAHLLVAENVDELILGYGVSLPRGNDTTHKQAGLFVATTCLQSGTGIRLFASGTGKQPSVTGRHRAESR